MHGTALLFGFGTSLAFIFMDAYHPATLWCWIAPSPDDYCEDDLEGICEKESYKFNKRMNFFYIPLWVCMIVMLGIQKWIYGTVRAREVEAKKLHAIHHAEYGRPYAGEQFRATKKAPRKKNMTTSVVLRDKMSVRKLIAFGNPPPGVRTSLEQGTSRESENKKGGSSSSLGFDEAIHSNSTRVQLKVREELHSIREDESQNESPFDARQEFENKEDSVRDGDDPQTTAPSAALPEGREKARENERQLPRVHTKEFQEETNENGSQSLRLPSSNGLQNSNRETELNGDGMSTMIATRIKSFFIHTSSRESSSSFFIKDDENHDPHDDDDNISVLSKIHSMTRLILPEKTAKMFSRRLQRRQSRMSKGPKCMDSVRSADVKFVLATVEDFPSAAKQYAASYHIGARLILYQSIAYVLGFWVVWIVPTIHQIVQNRSGENVYALILLHGLFQPLQGLFNFLVYRYAHYLRLSELHPSWTRRQLLQRTLRWTFLSRKSDLDEISKSSSRNSTLKNVINSMGIGLPGDLQLSAGDFKSSEDINVLDVDSDDESFDSDDSDLMPSSDVNLRRNSAAIRRMSSMMGDLMMEFTDDPAVLNEAFVEVSGEGLFSSPLFEEECFSEVPTPSSFPTIYAEQSFSEIPASQPVFVPHFPVMTDFPVVESSTEFKNRQPTECADTETTVKSNGHIRETSKNEDDESQETNGNKTTVESIDDMTPTIEAPSDGEEDESAEITGVSEESKVQEEEKEM